MMLWGLFGGRVANLCAVFSAVILSRARTRKLAENCAAGAAVTATAAAIVYPHTCGSLRGKVTDVC